MIRYVKLKISFVIRNEGDSKIDNYCINKLNTSDPITLKNKNFKLTHFSFG